MAKPKVSLRGAGCRKANCRTPTGILHRHHVRHQAMWLGIWSSRRSGEKKFQDFIRRYYEFRKEDIEYLCDRHHAEIHAIYDEIIIEDRKKLGKPLSKYTWAQAELLMDKLEAAFREWLNRRTPGLGSRTLQARRRVRKLLKDQ